MEIGNVRSRVVTIVAEMAEVESSTVTPEISLRNELDIDSLTMVDMVTQIQDDFGVKIEDEDLAGIQTVEDLVQYINGRP